MMKDSLGLYYDYKITKGDKVIKKSRLIKCKSFVKQFLDLLYWEMTGRDISIIDTAGVTQTLTWENSKLWIFTAGVGTTTYGNVVGSGSTAVTVTDYALQTKIAHGTGAGQLQYSAETFGAPTTDAAGTSFINTRIFTNGTGNDVVVREIGIYAAVTQTTPDYYFMIARDILSPAITLSNGEALTVNYTFSTAI